MKLNSILNFFTGRKIDKKNIAVLRISLLLAALDGNIADAELKTFYDLAKSCEGFTDADAEKALADTLRSAGYLMLSTRLYDRSVIIQSFVSEADAILPSFETLTKPEIASAVELWEKMAMADGDFSEVEHEAIDYLKKYLGVKADCQAMALGSGFACR